MEGTAPSSCSHPSREVTAGRGIDVAVLRALKVSVGPREIGLAGQGAKVRAVAVLHTLVPVTVSTVGPVTADAVITHVGVPIVTGLPGLQDPIPTRASMVYSVVHRVERGHLDREPAKAVLEVQRPLIPAEGNGILGVQPLKLLLVVNHKNHRNSWGAGLGHGLPVGRVVHVEGSTETSSWRPRKSSVPFGSYYKLS